MKDINVVNEIFDVASKPVKFSPNLAYIRIICKNACVGYQIRQQHGPQINCTSSAVMPRRVISVIEYNQEL